MNEAKTMSLRARLVLILVLMVGWGMIFGLPVPAAEERASSQAYVILVGVGDFADKQIKPQTHAEADARALYDLFAGKDHRRADAVHVRLLLGTADAQRQSEPATRENILKAVHWAVSKARRDDLVLFAFIGSGAPLGDRCCYFAADSTFKDRAKNAVAAADIEQELEKLKSHHLCVFLDVNFKGFDPGAEAAPDLNLSNFYKEFLGKDEETPRENDPNGSRVIFLANRGLMPGLQADQQGVFVQTIVEALKGGADKEGYEPDGAVTVEELTQYLDKELPPRMRKQAKTKDEKELNHLVLGGRASRFILTRNPAAAAQVEARLAKFAKLAEDRKLGADEELAKALAEEGRNLLDRMPRPEALRTLRKHYQQLTDGKLTLEEFRTLREQVHDRLKLKRTDALKFASVVVAATEMVNESYVREVNQGELVAWAVRGMYQRLEEKLPQEVEDLLGGAKKMKEAELLDLLAKARQHLGKREDLDNHKDIDVALQRMLNRLDPHTTYIDPETLSQFERDMKKKYTGVGIQIRKHAERDMLMVVTPIKGSPAYKAGIKAGDVITHIVREMDSDGKLLDKPEILSTKGMPLPEAVKKCSGKANTKVKLTVEREGEPQPLEFEIVRNFIELETVVGVQRKDNDDWDYLLDPQNQIAYVRLTSFAGASGRDLKRVVDDLEKQGMKGLVLDLRFNPGGYLTSAREISDLFIDDGKIVSVRYRANPEETFKGRATGSKLDFPMVCLINGGSASASEIVSACLQDHKRAVIVGERSYGKGSVQHVQPFDGGEIKLTIASFWRPSGKNLNKSSTSGKETDEWGVTPDQDFVVKLTRQEREDLAEHLHDAELIVRRDAKPKDAKAPFKDRQLEKAVEYLRDQVRTAAKKG